MEWPPETNPKRTRYAVIEALRKLNLSHVILLLLAGYLLINVSFCFLYFFVKALLRSDRFIDYLYFSFVTGLTIGFGDFLPGNDCAKIIAIIQGLVSTFYFAMMVAFLGVKMLFPSHTIHFSDKVLFDGDRSFMFRILNSHRGLLVHPDIRINVVAHCFGNAIAPTICARKVDNFHWLDNHDLIIDFPNVIDGGFSVFEEWEKARHHCGAEKSRFKIRVSVSGSYGMQQYTQVISYGKDDIVCATRFKPIRYSDEDKRIWRNIRFKKFGNFWNDFNSFENNN
jgi:hypothetical protein